MVGNGDRRVAIERLAPIAGVVQVAHAIAGVRHVVEKAGPRQSKRAIADARHELAVLMNAVDDIGDVRCVRLLPPGSAADHQRIDL